ncbi:MAG: DUF4352 domain-containing protein [Desulfobacterales bacterium]|nr:DUF4352 domain-containing protein [Desulfobacterales bacterium]
MSLFGKKNFPKEAPLYEELTVKNITISVSRLVRFNLTDFIQYSLSSLVFMDGIHSEEDKHNYAHDKSVFFMNILYQNRSKKEIEAFSTQWRLLDENGYIHKTTSIDESINNALELPKLYDSFINPNRKLRAWLAFVVPAKTVIEYVSFTTGFLSGKSVEFIVPEKVNKFGSISDLV